MSFLKNLASGLASAASSFAGAFGNSNPWTSIASAGLNGLFSSFQQDQASKDYMRNQLDLLQNQQQFQEHMFDRSLDANRHSILDQYAQYRELGINPLSLNGSMNQSNVSIPSAPSAPTANYTSPAELAQIRLADSQSAKNYAEARAIDPNEAPARTALMQSQTTTEDALRPWRGQLYKGQYNLCLVECEKAYKSIDALDTEMKRTQKDIDYYDASKYYEFLLHDKEFRKLDAESQAIISEISRQWFLAKWSAKVSQSEIDVNKASSDLLHQQTQTELENTQIKALEKSVKVMEEHLGVSYQRAMKELSDIDFKIVSDENQRLRLEFDTQMYKSAPKAVKSYRWFMEKVPSATGLLGKFFMEVAK